MNESYSGEKGLLESIKGTRSWGEEGKASVLG